jgi:hypothetical protein
MACRITELVLDARDPEALAEWWCAVLDYRVVGREDDGSVEIGPADGGSPTIVFGAGAGPKRRRDVHQCPSRGAGVHLARAGAAVDLDRPSSAALNPTALIGDAPPMQTDPNPDT